MNRSRLRVWLLAGVGSAAFLLALISWATGALSGLEAQSLHARFSIRGSRGAPANMVIVGPTETDFQYYKERAPLQRRHYAALFDRLHADGARLIAVDLSFGGLTDPADDRALSAALSHDGPILVGADLLNGQLRGALDRPVSSGTVIAPLAVVPGGAAGVQQMYYAAYGHPMFAVRAAQLLGRSVQSSDFPGNQAWIDFRGAPFTFPAYKLASVVNGSVPASTFAGKVVLIGDLDSLDKDFQQTVAGYMPGVELQANALATILDGLPLGPLGGGWVLVLLLVTAALPSLLALRLPSLYVMAASLALLLVFLVCVQLAFDSGTIVPVPDPILALALGSAGAIAADALLSRLALRRLLRFLEVGAGTFFISYRHGGADETFANILRDQLEEKFGEGTVFKDDRSIDAGSEFPSRIENAVLGCKAMLVVIGPGWHELRGADDEPRLFDERDWVRREIEIGLASEGVTVVPLRFGAAKMPSRDELPPSIQDLCNKHAVVLTGQHLHKEVDELVSSMDRGRLRDFVGRKEPVQI